MQALRRAAILRKVSFLQQLRSGGGGSIDAEGASRLRALGDPRVAAAHASHEASTDAVCSHLAQLGVEVRLKDELDAQDVSWADLVLSLGGDGTFLRATHAFGPADPTPIFGVNSSPESSFGFYCAADKDSFPDVLQRFLAGTLQTKKLWRMHIVVNGKPLPTLVLNDVLFAGRGAASIAYYSITSGDRTQVQKSSGVWVSTSAGSTAGILSAGGAVQPLYSRMLQFRVRELFAPSVSTEVPIIAGLFEDDVEIRPRMTDARLYLDGCNVQAEVGYNDSIRFRPSEMPLNWISSKFCDYHRRGLRTSLQQFRQSIAVAEHNFQEQLTSFATS